MSNIAEGLEYVLAQSRAARDATKVAEITAPRAAAAPVEAGAIGNGLRKVAETNLAARGEDVTVGDLQALMREFK